MSVVIVMTIVYLKTRIMGGRKMLKSLDEHNTEGWSSKPDRSVGPVPNGIACPGCGQELMDTPVTHGLLTNPMKNMYCLSCDYVGHRIN
jgi:hypothetical protein